MSEPDEDVVIRIIEAVVSHQQAGFEFVESFTGKHVVAICFKSTTIGRIRHVCVTVSKLEIYRNAGKTERLTSLVSERIKDAFSHDLGKAA